MIPYWRNSEPLAERIKQTWLQAQTQAEQEEAEWIQVYRDYYAGDFAKFQGVLTERQKQYLFQWQKLGYNLCKRACQSFSWRLTCTGLAPEKDQDELAQQVWSWLELDRMDVDQKDLYLDVARDGEAFILCWYPTQEQIARGSKRQPRFTLHTRYAGETGMHPVRDLDTGELEHVEHYWKQYVRGEKPQVFLRRTDYYPDHVEFWGTPGGAWERVQADAPLVARDGQSLGLPVISFVWPGGSKLADAVGHQDMLNKALLDLWEWEDKEIWPTDYVFGEEPAYASGEGETSTKKAVFERGPGMVWNSANPNVAVGTLEHAGSEDFLKVVERFEQIFLRATNLSPLDLPFLGASPWSGEALHAAEKSFVAEVEDLQIRFGNGWEDVARMLLRLEDTFGAGRVTDRDALFSAQWKDAALHESTFWANLAVKRTQLGYSDQQVQREAGLSEEEIERMREEQAEEEQARFMRAEEAIAANRGGRDEEE